MQEQIHDLLAKYFAGQANAEETDAVKQWSAASEENAADFRLLEKLWNKTGEEEVQIFDTHSAWQTVNAQLQKRKPKLIPMLRRRVMVAAAAIIVLLGAWWLFFPSGDGHTIVADTEVKAVTLGDGTKIWLRKGATMEYTNGYGKKDRHINLTGEAFFDVAHDTSLPFTIAAADANIKVVGTSFLVNTENKQVELVVKTGKVQFGGAEKILVTAGERAVFANNNISKEENTNINFNAWQTKKLVFSNTPLQQVVKDLSHYYRVKIDLAAPDSSKIAGMRFTADFTDGKLNEVFESLRLVSDIQFVRIRENEYEVRTK